MSVQSPPAATSVEIREGNNYFIVRFPYHNAAILDIKAIPGTIYKREADTWYVIKARKPLLDEWIKKYVEDPKPAKSTQRYAVGEMPELVTELKMIGQPFPYQAKGIQYNLDHMHTLNGDQPGLGKSLASLVSVNTANMFPCLVICPSTLKINWQKEWMKWTGKRAIVLTNSIKTSWPQYNDVGLCDVFITNYESLEKYFVLGYLNKPGQPVKIEDIQFRNSIHRFKSIIIDESHRVKNESTMVFKHVWAICQKKLMVLLLSGTPIMNTPLDLWAQLRILGKHKLFAKSKEDFVAQFVKVGAKKKPGNLDQLNYYLNKYCFFRREKNDVLKDLPPKQRQVIQCELSNRPVYDKAQNEFVAFLRDVRKCSSEEMATKLRGGFLTQMSELKRISARGKLDDVSQYITEIIEAGEKVIIFATLQEVLKGLKQRFPHALMIYGEIPLAERDRAVTLFQTDPEHNIMLCNIEAGGVGLTLTASSRVGFVELPWNFAKMEQAEDRAHRIGATAESIQCTSFLGSDTIDQYCYDLVMEKKSLHDMAMGTTDKGGTVQIIDSMLSYFEKEKEAKKASEKLL